MRKRRERAYPIDNGWDALFIAGCIGVSALGLTYLGYRYVINGWAKAVDGLIHPDHDPDFCDMWPACDLCRQANA